MLEDVELVTRRFRVVEIMEVVDVVGFGVVKIEAIKISYSPVQSEKELRTG